MRGVGVVRMQESVQHRTGQSLDEFASRLLDCVV